MSDGKWREGINLNEVTELCGEDHLTDVASPGDLTGRGMRK